jgi:chromosome segregation ATPase
LSYRAEVLRDQLLEHEGQATARPPALERICTALIDRDEALQQARGDLERMRTVATNWEADVTTARSDNQELRAWLREAQAQQSQDEERARAAEQRAGEADELKAALDAKVATLASAEDQLQQERTARQGVEGQLQQERAALADARSALERERAAREAAQKLLAEREADVSRLDGELIALSMRMLIKSCPSRSKAQPSSTCSRRSRPSAALSRWRRSRLKVSRRFVLCFADLSFKGSFLF